MSTLRVVCGLCLLGAWCFSVVSLARAPDVLGALALLFYTAAAGFFVVAMRQEKAARRRLLDTVEDRLSRPSDMVDL